MVNSKPVFSPLAPTSLQVAIVIAGEVARQRAVAKTAELAEKSIARSARTTVAPVVREISIPALSRFHPSLTATSGT